VNLESTSYAPKPAQPPATPVASPDHSPSAKIKRRLPEKSVGTDSVATEAFEPHSISKRESRAWPQEQGEKEKDHWPALPIESLGEHVAADAEGWEANLRAWQRRQKLDREQRGILWNESPS
jgi:hypothetical protein